MDYQTAIDTLKALLEKPSLSAEEKEAIDKAIGLLALGLLAKKRLSDQKARREKSTEW
jgi:hypothetical protein